MSGRRQVRGSEEPASRGNLSRSACGHHALRLAEAEGETLVVEVRERRALPPRRPGRTVQRNRSADTGSGLYDCAGIRLARPPTKPRRLRVRRRRARSASGICGTNGSRTPSRVPALKSASGPRSGRSHRRAARCDVPCPRPPVTPPLDSTYIETTFTLRHVPISFVRIADQEAIRDDLKIRPVVVCIADDRQAQRVVRLSGGGRQKAAVARGRSSREHGGGSALGCPQKRFPGLYWMASCGVSQAPLP